MLCSVVVPAYNSENTIRELIERFENVFSTIDCDHEIIIVDDGSEDSTWRILSELQPAHKKLKIIQLMKNFGKNYALLCGIKKCSGDYVIIMDDDLQDRPEDIPLLISSLSEDPQVDVVIARPKRKHLSLIKNVQSLIINEIENIFFRKKKDIMISSFVIMTRKISQHIAKTRAKNVLVIESLIYMTDRIKNVVTTRDIETKRKSRFSFYKNISLALDMVLLNSGLPLMIISYMGILCSFLSMSLAAFFFIRYLIIGNTITGWMTIVLINLFFPGVILLSFGVIGQYLVRITKEINYKPGYLIRDMKGFEE